MAEMRSVGQPDVTGAHCPALRMSLARIRSRSPRGRCVEHLGAPSDQVGALDRRGHLAVFDQVGSRRPKVN